MGYGNRIRYQKNNPDGTITSIRFWDDKYVEQEEEAPEMYKKWRLDVHNRGNNITNRVYYLPDYDNPAGLYRQTEENDNIHEWKCNFSLQ